VIDYQEDYEALQKTAAKAIEMLRDIIAGGVGLGFGGGKKGGKSGGGSRAASAPPGGRRARRRG